jgi:hypothetical protein
MIIDEIFASTAPGCRLIIDNGLPPWDRLAARGAFAGELTVVGSPPYDVLVGALVDEWEAALWSNQFRLASRFFRSFGDESQKQPGRHSGEFPRRRREEESNDEADEGGMRLRDAPSSLIDILTRDFRPFPAPRLRITVTHEEDPEFTVSKTDDNASLRFRHDPQQRRDDLGRALVYESGNLGGTWLRPILIEGYQPIWES